MKLLLALKRPFIWLSRFRHRCGYGVHSPFAFNLITDVIYQCLPYYKYNELLAEEKRLTPLKEKAWRGESLKVKRLLFRLVNDSQPTTLLDVGKPSAASLYLKAAKEDVDYMSASSLDELFLENDVPVDFLYLHDYRHPELVKEVFDICVSRTRQQSVFVIEGICYSAAMRKLWKQMQADVHVCVSFDLYDLGLLYFDSEKTKLHYIVNF